jgi:uracil-DNA glycosylase
MGNIKVEERGAAPFVPAERSFTALRDTVQACRGCDLYKDATQAVLGEGLQTAHLMFVGEQPGDHEDIEGRPFIGPAGRILDKALSDLGIARGDVYVTNAVKHFKWVPKGKRRIHQTPRVGEIRACKPWLEAEIDILKPELIVCLGSIAVQSLLGPKIKLLANRGTVVESSYGPCLLAVHPSVILRIEDTYEREAAYSAFITDLMGGLDFLARAQV